MSDDDTMRIASITFESQPNAQQTTKVQFLLQFLIDLQEQTMAISNCELRVASDSIKNHFKGSLSTQFFQK